MTVKQKRLIRALKANPTASMAEIGRKAGYSNISGTLYRQNTQKHVEAVFKLTDITPESVLNELDITAKQAEAVGDLNTKTRCIELKGKYLALWKDKNINENINPDKIIIAYHKNNAPERILERNTPTQIHGSRDNTDIITDVNDNTKVSNTDNTQPIVNTTVTPTSL